jgi:hypothetical protein
LGAQLSSTTDRVIPSMASQAIEIRKYRMPRSMHQLADSERYEC